MTTTSSLPAQQGDRWQAGAGTPLFNPVCGAEPTRLSSAALDVMAASAVPFNV